MIVRGVKPLAAGLAAFLFAGIAPGLAQTEGERAAVFNDWSVFTPAGEPRECYIVSPPMATTAQRDGETVQVNRGDIRLFVTFRPTEGVKNEVSFTGGYPLKDGSLVRVEVGSETFELGIGQGEASEWAWPASSAEDERLIAAFRRGADAKITGTSERGTTTIDTFSLMGFSAAIEDAASRCG